MKAIKEILAPKPVCFVFDFAPTCILLPLEYEPPIVQKAVPY